MCLQTSPHDEGSLWERGVTSTREDLTYCEVEEGCSLHVWLWLWRLASLTSDAVADRILWTPRLISHISNNVADFWCIVSKLTHSCKLHTASRPTKLQTTETTLARRTSIPPT